MLTIGIDIRNIGKKRTGDEVVFFNLVKNLAVIDERNSYQLLTDITDGKLLTDIRKGLGIGNKDNFKIISLESKNRFVWNFWTLPMFLKKNHLDIYLTQYITPFFIPNRTKIITIIHDISFNFFPQFIKKSDLIFLKLLIPVSLRRADKIVGVSKFTADEIVGYYKVDPQKVTWIHNAISDDFLQLADGRRYISDDEMKAVKEKYHLPDKYILYVGTLQPRKNLPLLVEAYKALEEKVSGIKLVLAGGKSHNYDEHIDRTVGKYNLEKDVILPGYIDEKDKAALMKGAWIFCLPSLYEGFGIPILEAMSVETPVAASDIPSQREVAGEAALFFNPKNPSELAQKLEILLEDKEKRNNLINKGKERLKIFSWRVSAEKMLDIFGGFEQT